MFLMEVSLEHTELFHTFDEVIAVEQVLDQGGVEHNSNIPSGFTALGVSGGFSFQGGDLILTYSEADIDASFSVENFPIATATGQINSYEVKYVYTDTGSRLGQIEFNPLISVSHKRINWHVDSITGGSSGSESVWVPSVGVSFPNEWGSLSLMYSGSGYKLLNSAITVGVHIRF